VPQKTDRHRTGGKGETVRQERTSIPGDRSGSANPTRSKAKNVARGGAAAQAPEGCSPEPAGRPLEAPGDGVSRWMVAALSPW